jgi:hypothetical protein
MLFNVELNYNARITISVDAENEGDALNKARDIADEADMEEFVLTSELESRIT